jgi:hypothetical protein
MASIRMAGPVVGPEMTLLEVRKTVRIRRPSEVVRCHFLDMHHHIAHGVHQGIRYTILAEEPGRLRLTQDFKVLGMPKRDEIILYTTPDGCVRQDFLSGDFAGGSIEVRFEDDGPATRLYARLRAPLRGAMALLRPVIRWQVSKLTDQALEEDRRDLEGGYQPGAWARNAVALSA